MPLIRGHYGLCGVTATAAAAVRTHATNVPPPATWGMR